MVEREFIGVELFDVLGLFERNNAGHGCSSLRFRLACFVVFFNGPSNVKVGQAEDSRATPFDTIFHLADVRRQLRDAIRLLASHPGDDICEYLANTDGWQLIWITGATLDRLTHRCHIIEASGESYRLRDAKRRREKRSSSKTTTTT